MNDQQKAIYIITNKINKKQYVGQSVDPHKRFIGHCNAKNKDNSLIDKAIQKYGRENFSLEILGWFTDYNEKEKYYIAAYETLAPNGYNILKGGEEPPHWKGEKHPMAKISKEIAESIQKDLQSLTMRQSQIRAKYKISKDILRHINEGSSWHREDLSYPLHPGDKSLDRERAKKVIHLLKTTSLSQKDIGKQVGLNRSAVTMINIGKNHFDSNEKYPIRGPQRNKSK